MYTDGLTSFTLVGSTGYVDVANLAIPLDADSLYELETGWVYFTNLPTEGLQMKYFTSGDEYHLAGRFVTFGSTPGTQRTGLIDATGTHPLANDSLTTEIYHRSHAFIRTNTAQTVKIQIACETASGVISIWPPAFFKATKLKQI